MTNRQAVHPEDSFPCQSLHLADHSDKTKFYGDFSDWSALFLGSLYLHSI